MLLNYSLNKKKPKNPIMIKIDFVMLISYFKNYKAITIYRKLAYIISDKLSSVKLC